MSETWYYARGARRCGPVTYEQLREKVSTGELSPIDMVFNEGASQWVSAQDVPGLGLALPPAAAPDEARPQSPRQGPQRPSSLRWWSQGAWRTFLVSFPTGLVLFGLAFVVGIVLEKRTLADAIMIPVCLAFAVALFSALTGLLLLGLRLLLATASLLSPKGDPSASHQSFDG